jgi:hypothetical protein
MKPWLIFLLLLAPGILSPPPLIGQEAGAGIGIDLLYPEFAHPREDVAAAIQRDDLRFIAIDRARRIVPGMRRTTISLSRSIF